MAGDVKLAEYPALLIETKSDPTMPTRDAAPKFNVAPVVPLYARLFATAPLIVKFFLFTTWESEELVLEENPVAPL